jgi:hypothetical protein
LKESERKEKKNQGGVPKSENSTVIATATVTRYYSADVHSSSERKQELVYAKAKEAGKSLKNLLSL